MSMDAELVEKQYEDVFELIQCLPISYPCRPCPKLVKPKEELDMRILAS